MSQKLQNTVAEITQQIMQFTMLPKAQILQLYSPDNDYKIAYHCLSLISQNKLPSPDITIVIEAPFDGDLDTYANITTVELCKTYDILKETLPNYTKKTSWQPTFILDEPESSTERFIRLLMEFTDLYKKSFDKLLLCFIPPSMTDEKKWIEFIKQIHHNIDNNKIRLGFIENITPLSNLKEALQVDENAVYYVEFHGKTYDIMLDVLNEHPDSNEYIEYQRHLVQAFQAQQESHTEQTLAHIDKALTIANSLNSKEMQIIAYNMLYAAHVRVNQFTQAQEKAQLAFDISQSITLEELDSRDELEAMAGANLATAALLNQQYLLAAQTYQKTAHAFFHSQNWMMSYENYRLSALCYSQEKNYTQAWERGGDAIVAFYQTPQSLWSHSTLIYLAKQLQQTAYFQNKETVRIFNEHMTALLGKQWRAQVDALTPISLPKNKKRGK
ncbi:TPA: hypothetical protein ACX6QK_002599 [Photobacterium damselae]